MLNPDPLGEKDRAKTPLQGQLFSKIQQTNTKHEIEIVKNGTEMLITFALYERANVLNSVASEMVVHFRGCAIARAFLSLTGHDHCS